MTSHKKTSHTKTPPIYRVYKDPLAHEEFEFINVIYFSSIDMLIHLDKDVIRQGLHRAKLACECLEGLLKLADKLEPKGE